MKLHSKSLLLKHTLEIATVILAFGTIILAVATIWLAVETRLGMTRQTQVSTWLEMEKRFDGPEMKRARKNLAVQLNPYEPKNMDKIDETVMDMFDDMGSLYRRNFIDRELTESFSYHVTRWWKACEPYITDIRKQPGGKDSFKDFEDFAKEMRKKEDQPVTEADMKAFLEDEKRLVIYN
jgi:hypothetical protein